MAESNGVNERVKLLKRKIYRPMNDLRTRSLAGHFNLLIWQTVEKNERFEGSNFIEGNQKSAPTQRL